MWGSSISPPFFCFLILLTLLCRKEGKMEGRKEGLKGDSDDKGIQRIPLNDF